jgi:hypothetical protein
MIIGPPPKFHEVRGILPNTAAGASLTVGASLLVRGISREQMLTKAHCGKCGSDWTIA